MVQQFQTIMPLTLHSGAKQNKFVAFTETRGNASALVKTLPSIREDTRVVLLSQAFDPDTSDIFISSWRQATTINYFHYKKVNNISLVKQSVLVALAFLISLFKKGKHTIKYVLGSALASIITP